MWAVLPVLGVLWLGMSAAPVAAQNLITNGDCSTTGPAGWSSTNVDCQNVSGSFPDAPNSGQTGSLYFATVNSGQGTASQTITGIAGDATYDFEVYIATFDTTPQQDAIIVTLQFQDASGSNLGAAVTLVDTGANNSYPSSSTWERRATTGIAAPSGTAQALLTAEFIGDGDGFVDTFFDAFSLVQASAPPTNSPPVFTSTGPFAVTEGASAGATVGDVDANDGDGGATDAGITYSITGGNAGSAFAIDANGVITVNTASAVDFETNPSFSLTVEADDGGSSNNTNTAPVTVNVTDDAPSAPADVNAAADEVSEAASNGDPVGVTASASDPSGGSITYRLTDNADGRFQINASTGDVSVANAALLDFESNTSHTVSIAAQDADGTQSAASSVSIAVTNVDEPPVFTATGPFSVSETATGGTAVGDVDATDGDGGATDANVTYAITGGNINLDADATPAFAIDGASGVVTVSDPGDLDHETVSSVSLTVEASDGTFSPTTSVSISITDVNEAPTITALDDQTINEDGALSPVSFTVGDAETAASALSVTATSGNPTLVPDANITLGGTGATRTIEITPAAEESGTATITVTVQDDGSTPQSADEAFVLTVTNVPDLSITDGAASGLDVTGDATPGTPNNLVGAFALSAGSSGAAFEAATLTNSNPGVAGLSAARLFASSDLTLDPSADTELAALSLDPASAPTTLSFSGFSDPVPTSARYVLLAVDVAANAPAEDVLFTLAAPRDLTVTGSELKTVNGQAQTTFTDLPLSSGGVTLPVEMAAFTATPSGTAVDLAWTTATETGNAGFDIERRVSEGPPEGASGGAWERVARVEGAGTTTEAQRYRFTDTDLPYETETIEYRLRQVDVDGRATIAAERVVTLSGPGGLELLGTYPNPARAQVTARVGIPDGVTDARLVLFDLLGRQVRTLAVGGTGRQTPQLNTSDLAPGIYFLRLTGGGQVRTQKLTVVR